MNTDQREIRRKIRILEHAEQRGNVGNTGRRGPPVARRHCRTILLENSNRPHPKGR